MPSMWMDVDAAVTVPVNVAALLDDTDFKTREESVTFDQAGLDLVWNFVETDGTRTNTEVTPTDGDDHDWTNLGNGMYTIDMPTSGGDIDNDTEGVGWFSGFATGILPWIGPTIGFRDAGLNDLLINDTFSVTRGLTGTAVPAVAADDAGGLPISDAGGLDLDNLILDGLKDAGIILSRAAIETVNSQTEFIIPATDDPVNNDAINGSTAIVIDQADPNQRAVLLVSDYVASTRAVTVAIAAEFTVLAGDTLIILSAASTKGVWDRILTGATHNIASSAGRRLRGVQAFGDYANGALWFDSANGVGGQVEFENATVQNPSNSLTDVLALASSLNMVRIEVAPSSTLTLDAAIEGFTVVGENWTLALGSQSVSGSYFHGADVSGIGTGATPPHFHECHLGATSLPPCHLEFVGFEGVLTLTGAGNYFLDDCHAAVLSPALDFEDANENKNVFLAKYGGDIEIRNIGQAASTDTLHIDGNGKLILASTCEAATIEVQGNIEIEDNVAGGFVDGAGGTLNDDARVDRPSVADAVADEVLTGASHNVSNSLGRRIRELDDLVGYEGGAVWLDTVNGVAGDTPGDNGTVDNPTKSITDAVTIAVAKGLVRIRVASGSTVTLLAALEGYEIFNSNWTLILNSQSISGSCITGAKSVTGVATGAVPPRLINCNLGAITLPPCMLDHCGVGLGSGTFTFGSAGDYNFDDCKSLVAGSGTPNFAAAGLGAATTIGNRGWKGGAAYTLDSDITLSHEVLAGGGTTVTTGGADVEIRGITRSVTLTLSNAGTVQFIGITGPITISGTATSTVKLYGISSSLADTSSGTSVTDSTTSKINYMGSGMTSLAEWLGAMAGKQASDATAQTEMRATGAGSGSYIATADSQEAIRDRGDTAWTTGGGASSILLSAEISSAPTQLTFVLESGSDQDDAYNEQTVVFFDDSNSDFPSVRKCTDWDGGTLTLTIDVAPNFTVGADDSVRIFVTPKTAIGTGGDQVTINVKDSGGTPLGNASVWITLDAAGANVFAGVQTTDSNGDVLFLLDDGNTYFLWARKGGFNEVEGQSFVANAD